MKRWALIEGNVVNMVVKQDTQPEVNGTWVECPYEVGPGWLYDGVSFTPPPPPPVEP